ncbi:MAG: hypothetical protein ACKV2O_11115 [Acidimicrobiales bacterium]
MSDMEIRLTQDEAFEILEALDRAHESLVETNDFAVAVAVEDAIAILNWRLFPDLPTGDQ